MIGSAEILAAFRELSNVKQLDRAELYGLLQDGIMAALAKKYGPNVQAEVDIDDGKGEIRIVLLKDVVDSVEDSSRQIAVDDARSYDEGFQVGDVLEEPIDFAVFGRAAVQAAKQRIIQRVREGERTRIRDDAPVVRFVSSSSAVCCLLAGLNLAFSSSRQFPSGLFL